MIIVVISNLQMHTEWRKEWGPTEIMESSHYSAVREAPYQDLLAMDIQRGRDQGESQVES